jgi:hypothetical protein
MPVWHSASRTHSLQRTPVPGVNGRHVFVASSQPSFAPQSALLRHSTHAPSMQTLNPVMCEQSPSPAHATQLFVSHRDAVPVGQSVFASHSTHSLSTHAGNAVFVH